MSRTKITPRSVLRRLRAALIESSISSKEAVPTQLIYDLRHLAENNLPIPDYLLAEGFLRSAMQLGWRADNFSPSSEGLGDIITSASLGSAEAFALLSKASRYGLFIDELPANSPVELLQNAVGREGRIADMRELAELYDTGKYFEKKLPEHSDKARLLYKAALARIFPQSGTQKSAMIALGDMVADGQGIVLDSMQQGWRQALFYWLRAAGSRRPLTLSPRLEDFPRAPDSAAIIAMHRVSRLLRTGKATKQNFKEGLRILYRMSKFDGSAASELGAYWLNRQLETPLRRTYPRVLELQIARRHFIKAQALPDVSSYAHWRETTTSLNLDLVQNQIDLLAVVNSETLQRFKIARDSGIREAAIALALIAVLIDRRKYDELFPDRARLPYVRDLWRLADSQGSSLPHALSSVILDDAKSELLLAASDRNLGEIMPPPFTEKSTDSIANDFGLVRHDPALSLFNRHVVLEEEMWWLDLRHYLSELLVLDDSPGWAKLHRSIQMYFALPKIVGVSLGSLSRAELSERIIKNTNDVGPLHNRLDKDGRPLPYTYRTDPSPTRGWMEVRSIIIRGGRFRASGVPALYGPPLITDEDINVLFALALLDDGKTKAPLRFSLSLEFIEKEFETSQRWHFFWKRFSPSWLAATEVGKSKYFADRLLGDADLSGSFLNFTQTTAADREQLHPPLQPWLRSANAGGFRTTATSRLMVSAKRKTKSPMISEDARNNNGYRIDIVPLRGFIDGGEITMIDGEENRTFNSFNWRAGAWRKSITLSEHYHEMEEAFPVFRRSRMIKEIYTSICDALPSIDGGERRSMQSTCSSVRERYQKALATMSVLDDVVFR